jgi:hypothetical protein
VPDDELSEGEHPLGEHHGEVVHDLLDLQRRLRGEGAARPRRSAARVSERDGRVVNLVPLESAATPAEEPPQTGQVPTRKPAPKRRAAPKTTKEPKPRARKRAPRKPAPVEEPANIEPSVELSALSPGERLAYEVASELGLEPEMDLDVPERDPAEDLGLTAPPDPAGDLGLKPPPSPSLELRLARLERHLSSVLNDLRDHQFRSQELARTIEDRLNRIDEILRSDG